MKKITISLALIFWAISSFAQTGQCNNSPFGACTSDSACTGTGNYCHVLKHIVFIVKENRSFDDYFGTYPGVTGGPVGTAAHPFACSGTSGGCSSGTLPGYAAIPTTAQTDCPHTHSSAVTDYNGGSMNKFNTKCTGSGNLQNSWAAAYGKACSDYTTSHQLCASNSDCTSGSCNQNTLSTYWTYAQNYGLADHMFSSMMGPSYPEHMYIFTGTSAESSDIPEMQSVSGTGSPNGQYSQAWNCDSYHFGRCSNAATTLCSTNSDCSGGGTCTINQGTGFGYYNASTSCTKNSDLGFSLTNVVGNGTTATANCATNCGAMISGIYVQLSGNSNSNFNSPTEQGFLVASVTGSPVTSFTFASATNATGTGGTAQYDYCANGNVYQGSSVTMFNIDQLGDSATFYVPGTCSANNTQACGCSNAIGNNAPPNPCTDITGTCAGSSTNCVPLQNIGSTRGAACPNITTIGDRLDAASVSWKVYNQSDGGSAELWNPVAYISHLRYGSDWTNNVNTTIGQFITDVGNCTSDSSCTSLPSVSWVNTYVYSEHPTDTTVAQGMNWTAQQVNAVMNNSYLWKHSVIFIVWDDFGGFYDHIAPAQDSMNFETGFRVPFLCVGAYCNNAVNTTTFRFESMLKCVENQFGLSALNGNDANANDVCTSAGGMVNLSLANAPLNNGTVGASAMQKNTQINLNTSIQ